MAAGNYGGNNNVVSHREARPLSLGLGDNGNAEDFDTRFQQAVDLTRDVSISKMERQDLELLNKMMHERERLLATSSIFHYVRFAGLFDISRLDARGFENAEAVIEYLIATREEELTVADVLQKLRDTRRCCDIVRRLVDNITQRG